MFADLIRLHFPELPLGKIGLLEAHYELLLRWNEKINLTRIIDLPAAVERHYCESLFLGSHLAAIPLTVVDIGSGAGFPGIPVAVLRPDCTVTLVESQQRKAVFLREASRKLSNVHVIAKRAEEVQQSFEIGTSRAVSYKDLTGTLGRLARRALLLTGAEAPPGEMGFRWDEPIPLPWDDHRVLRVGNRVSRETQTNP